MSGPKSDVHIVFHDGLQLIWRVSSLKERLLGQPERDRLELRCADGAKLVVFLDQVSYYEVNPTSEEEGTE